jgi:hypothetical protein
MPWVDQGARGELLFLDNKSLINDKNPNSQASTSQSFRPTAHKVAPDIAGKFLPASSRPFQLATVLRVLTARLATRATFPTQKRVRYRDIPRRT